MRNKPTILLVDDDAVTLRILSELLRKMEFTVIPADDPLKAVEMAINERPDLIVLDIFMPVRNGWSVLSQIRAQELTAQTPVIILTSDEYSKSEELANELGVSHYLNKPINPDLLTKKILESLSGSPSA